MSEQTFELGTARALLKSPSFRRFWFAQFSAIMAAYSLTLAGLALVEEQTHSSAQTGLVILSSILPAFLASLLAGALVDRRGRVTVLLTSHITRTICALAFWAGTLLLPPGPAVASIYLVNVAIAIMSQFALTSELALVPDLVPKEHLISANALLQLSMLAAEGIGIVALSPLLIKLWGVPAVGLVAAGLCLLSAFLVAHLPRDQTSDTQEQETEETWQKLGADLRAGWQTIARDRLLGSVVLQATLAAALLLVLVSLLPGLASRHLGLNVEDVPYLMLPGGLGFVLGSILMSRWEKGFSRQAWIGAGLTGVGLTTLLLGFLSGGNEYLWMVVLVIFGLGLTLSLVIIPARTVLQERPPAELRGRVISAQLALGNAAAVVPLVLGGTLADHLGIQPVLAGLGLLTIVAGILGLYQSRDK